jgi:hypothetical protein
LQCGAQAGTAGADDDYIELTGGDCSIDCCHDYTLQRICTVHTA